VVELKIYTYFFQLFSTLSDSIICIYEIISVHFHINKCSISSVERLADYARIAERCYLCAENCKERNPRVGVVLVRGRLLIVTKDP
jgi:hypothetical protein